MNSVFVLGGAGCLLPTLIIVNLLWGWVFLKPLQWLLLEGLLVFLFLLQTRYYLRKVMAAARRPENDGSIDVRAQVMHDPDPKHPYEKP